MEHERTRTLVVVMDVVEARGMDVVTALGTFVGGPGVHFRKAYWDDAPRNAPVDALKAPGSDGSPPEDQQAAGHS